jgi:hypothetical protein
MSRKVHVELLVGRRVIDVNDRVVGRIRSIHARRRGQDYVVEEYRIGPAAVLEALGISTARMIGFQWGKPLCIPWKKLDLSDPERPRLRCAKEELERES